MKNRKPKVVVLDANFLMVPHELKVDVLGDVRELLGRVKWVVPSPVLHELKTMAKGGKVAAQVGLEMLEQINYRVVESDLSADKAVVDVAKREGGYVASVDAEVRKGAREGGLKLITLMGKQQLKVKI